MIWTTCDNAPLFHGGRRLVETGCCVTDRYVLGFCTRDILLTMHENDRIDPLATTDATPVVRVHFDDPLRHHQPTATMTPIDTKLLND